MYGLTPEQQELARYIAVLRGYPIFEGIPAAEIALLVEAVAVDQRKEGTVIVQQGAVEERFYLIARGDVTVIAQDGMQREHHIASLARGDCFGEVSLLFDTPRTATVRAASDTVLLVLHRERFYEVLAQTPALKDRLETIARSRADQTFAARTAAGDVSGPAVPAPAHA